jgi:hypothetical protein
VATLAAEYIADAEPIFCPEPGCRNQLGIIAGGILYSRHQGRGITTRIDDATSVTCDRRIGRERCQGIWRPIALAVAG